MAEYIEKKSVIDAIWQGCGACAEELEQLPVVEIVRCGECASHGKCWFENQGAEFCSQGKVKEQNENETARITGGGQENE